MTYKNYVGEKTKTRLQKYFSGKFGITQVKAGLSAFIGKLMDRLKTYFSGKLAIIQVSAGVGAFVGRTTAVLILDDFPIWAIIVGNLSASFIGYILVYLIGYWLAFRSDYKETGRSIIRDVARLQIIEQTPNIATVAAAGITQGALIGGTDINTVVAVNVGSWFGPQKIVNLLAMLTSNTMKKAWVDHSWSPIHVLRELAIKVWQIPKNLWNSRFAT